MKKISLLLLPILLIAFVGCTHDTNGLELATYPTMADVFIDGFSGDLQYAAFGGSNVKSFDVDKEVKYSGTASMKFAVPDVNDPEGNYSGGVYYSTTGRDLSQYNCLTFWAKASKSASIDQIGFGNDLGANKYVVSLSGVSVNTNWKKYYIPIPDASKLIAEKGMLFYSEGPEDGNGYTFWIDEVQFEYLGTVAHLQPQILNGEEQIVTTYNNVSIAVDGMSAAFNLPNGINQTATVSPAYFEFSSSNPSVATVSETGIISVIGGGKAVVTAKIAGIEAKGALSIESEGAFVSAPTPTVDADKVISLYSDAYSNVPVDYFNGFWEPYQTTLSSDFEIEGNHVLYYSNFNFVGTGFANPTVDASKMSHLHLDILVPKGTIGGQLTLTLRDFGQDGVDGGTDDTNYLQTFTDLTAGAWNSLDMPIKAMATRSKVGLIIYENAGSALNAFYADNIYFYNDGSIIPIVPPTAAPTPVQASDKVLSIFSDAYSNVDGTDFYPNWGQSTVVTQTSIAGNNTLQYSNLNYQGTQFADMLDVSNKTHLHLDYYTSNTNSLDIYLISNGPKEKAYALTVPSSINWNSVDIPLSAFIDVVNIEEIIQFKIVGNGDVYFDNIYFFNDGSNIMPKVPTMAAPQPIRPSDIVLSVFSDAYTNVEGTDFNPGWGQSTVVEQLPIAGNNTLFYKGLNYQGTALAGTLDVTEKTHLHLDYYTANSTLLKIFLISSPEGDSPAKEKPFELTVPSSINWTSVDIPLSEFSDVVNLAGIFQFKVEGNGDIYLDNIYFYNEKGILPDVPASAAPTPAQPSANVISIFSDAYTNVEGTDFNPGWGQSTVVEQLPIAGNNTLFYKGLNYQGTALAGTLDVSGKTYLHLDYYTANSTSLKISLISSPEGDSPAKEKPYDLKVPSSINWTSVDIPLSEFSDVVNLSSIFQFKVEGNGNIYLDNLYFH